MATATETKTIYLELVDDKVWVNRDGEREDLSCPTDDELISLINECDGLTILGKLYNDTSSYKISDSVDKALEERLDELEDPAFNKSDDEDQDEAIHAEPFNPNLGPFGLALREYYATVSNVKVLGVKENGVCVEQYTVLHIDIDATSNDMKESSYHSSAFITGKLPSDQLDFTDSEDEVVMAAPHDDVKVKEATDRFEIEIRTPNGNEKDWLRLKSLTNSSLKLVGIKPEENKEQQMPNAVLELIVSGLDHKLAGHSWRTQSWLVRFVEKPTTKTITPDTPEKDEE